MFRFLFCAWQIGVGTPGGIRTHTSTDLNRVPHANWATDACWRRGRDSNPREVFLPPPVFQTGTIGLSDTSPDIFFWQGQQGSNLRHMVLETIALPTELYPCVIRKNVMGGIFFDYFRSLCFLWIWTVLVDSWLRIEEAEDKYDDFSNDRN